MHFLFIAQLTVNISKYLNSSIYQHWVFNAYPSCYSRLR